MSVEHDRDSKWDLLIPVDMVVQEGANPDPTVDPVNFGFVEGYPPPRSRPNLAALIPGYWLQEPGQLFAGILIGPGGAVELARGPWCVFLQVIDDPTQPFEFVDWFKLT